MIWKFLYNVLLNFLLDLKRLIISGDKLCSNDKFNIKFLLEVCGLIVFKVILYERLLRICIDINGNKPTFHQSLLMLFLVIDFSCVWEINSIYSTQGIYYRLSQLIIYILIIYYRLNAANISISNDYSIYE